MVAQGIPEKDIAFIHDYKTADERDALFEEVRAGRVRVVIASTEKMGVGVNVQDRAAALHHVDAPWRPRDIEQREGRVIRQGNYVYGPRDNVEGRGVQVFQYVQRGGFDEYMWQTLEKKARGIKSLMRRHHTERKVADIDPLVLAAGDTKAAAAANPLVKRYVELEHGLHGLRLENKAHNMLVRTARERIEPLEAIVTRDKASLPNLKADAAYVASLDKEKGFSAIVQEKHYDKSTEAGKAIATVLKKLPYTSSEHMEPLGVYKGFAVGAQHLEAGYRLVLARPETQQAYYVHFGTKEDINADGVMRKLQNQIDSIPTRARSTEQRIKEDTVALEQAQQQAGRHWPKLEQLNEQEAELAEVTQRLEAGETGEDEDVVYGLQPLPVDDWSPEQAAAAQQRPARKVATPLTETDMSASTPEVDEIPETTSVASTEALVEPATDVEVVDEIPETTAVASTEPESVPVQQAEALVEPQESPGPEEPEAPAQPDIAAWVSPNTDLLDVLREEAAASGLPEHRALYYKSEATSIQSGNYLTRMQKLKEFDAERERRQVQTIIDQLRAEKEEHEAAKAAVEAPPKPESPPTLSLIHI